MPDVELTWLGHAAFRFDTPGGKRVYVDPFLSGNPKTPESEKEPERVDVIAITHAHGDHVGDTVEIWKRHKPSIVAIVEVKDWLASQGAEDDTVQGSNKGGTVEAAGVKFTLVNAYHSGGLPGRRATAARPAASSSRSRTARRSTSPATRASSATCS